MSTPLDAIALATAALHDDQEAGAMMLDAADLRPLAWQLARWLADELRHDETCHGAVHAEARLARSALRFAST